MSTNTCGFPEPTPIADIGFPSMHILLTVFYEVVEQFIRGDADANGTFNGLVDALYILDHQFLGGPELVCLESGDADGDGFFSGLNDALYVLSHGFTGGPSSPAPFPACGEDPDLVDSLGCNPVDACM